MHSLYMIQQYVCNSASVCILQGGQYKPSEYHHQRMYKYLMTLIIDCVCIRRNHSSATVNIHAQHR